MLNYWLQNECKIFNLTVTLAIPPPK